MNALDQTQQKHASNYIRGKGERATEYGDDWPLIYCTAYSRLQTNMSKLVDLIDQRKRFTEMKCSQLGALTLEQKHSIENGGTDEIKDQHITYT